MSDPNEPSSAAAGTRALEASDATDRTERLVGTHRTERLTPGSELGDDVALRPGALIGDYVVARNIGGGGCGTVYAASHRLIGRKAAIKVLHSRLARSPKMIKRFVREARAVNVIDHPNIVDVYEFGTLPDGRPYQVMEVVPGVTLAELVRDRGRMSPEQTLELLAPLCSALQAAHDAGVIHRDLKPSNVMVEIAVDPPRVTLLDFGMAKLLDVDDERSRLTTGTLIGTPQVMAPEQIRGDPPDPRVDVYAIGVMAFTMLTGRPPFVADDIGTVLDLHLTATAPAPSEHAPVSRALDAVIGRCLEKSPHARYGSIADFLAHLRAAVVGDARPATPEAARRPAIAVFVSARVADPAGASEELVDLLSERLDRIEDALADAGLRVVVATGNALLGARPLPDDADRQRVVRRRALAVANELHEQLAAVSERLAFSVAVHVDDATVAAAEIVGGPLLQTATWVRDGTPDGPYVTESAKRGV